ncbi:MAG: S41 family peptidase [Bacteroidales bacterium]|nr:S41 family peptidase [Candidatus Cryptobacteroides caccocaballi]
MMKTHKILLAALLAAGVSMAAGAQNKTFKLGQWIEIENNVIRELNRFYADSLPVDRMMKASIDAMLEELDPYTVYVPEEENEDFEMLIHKSYGGIGAVIHKKPGEYVSINEPYAGSPAQKYGLRCGDQIMEIDGVDVRPLTSSESSERMKGKPGTTVVFKVKKVHTGEIVEVPIVRERIHLPDIEYAGMVDDTTGYVYQSGFTENASSELRASIIELKKQGMKRLVYDLRGNGGGLIQEAISIVSIFVPKGTLVVTSKGTMSSNGQSKKDSNELFVNEYRTSAEPVDTELSVIVLIDGASASASEIVSGALQDLDRATIMGKRSYGKGLVQTIRPVAYNGTMKITTAKYYTPSGRCVQARDYSKRNEDGSVGEIPDSLTNEFKTAHGRTVRDGGGITPDVDIPIQTYSRLVYSLVVGGIIDTYALDYACRHEKIAPLDEFHYTDADYEDFVKYAMTQTFDYRSSAKALFDQMKKELKEDGIDESMSEELAALEKAIDMDKEKFLRLKKDEIIPFIEEEIAVRYYYQAAGIKVRIRHDSQLETALKSPLISY